MNRPALIKHKVEANIPESIYFRLKTYADKAGMKYNTLIRIALEEYLSNHNA